MELRIGQVTNYYQRIGVAVLDLNDRLKVGDTIHILGHTTNLTQRVESMQIEHQPVETAGPGAEVALKVNDRVRKGDAVYKVIETQADESGQAVG